MHKCVRCNAPCDGTLMRTHPRYKRVRALITDDAIPKLPNGGPALCHACQRSVYFRNGYLPLMIADLKREAVKQTSNGRSDQCPHCGSRKAYDITTRQKRKCKMCGRQYSAKANSAMRAAKLKPKQESKLRAALKTMSVNQAAKVAGVQYRTAWRFSKLMNET